MWLSNRCRTSHLRGYFVRTAGRGDRLRRTLLLQSARNRTAMRGCQRDDAPTAWSTSVTTLLTAPVVEAAAGTDAPTWLAAVVTDDPSALTVLPFVDVRGPVGGTGLAPAAGGGR